MLSTYFLLLSILF